MVANLFKIPSSQLIQNNGVVYLADGQVLVNPRA